MNFQSITRFFKAKQAKAQRPLIKDVSLHRPNLESATEVKYFQRALLLKERAQDLAEMMAGLDNVDGVDAHPDRGVVIASGQENPWKKNCVAGSVTGVAKLTLPEENGPVGIESLNMTRTSRAQYAPFKQWVDYQVGRVGDTVTYREEKTGNGYLHTAKLVHDTKSDTITYCQE